MFLFRFQFKTKLNRKIEYIFFYDLSVRFGFKTAQYYHITAHAKELYAICIIRTISTLYVYMQPLCVRNQIHRIQLKIRIHDTSQTYVRNSNIHRFNNNIDIDRHGY